MNNIRTGVSTFRWKATAERELRFPPRDTPVVLPVVHEPITVDAKRKIGAIWSDGVKDHFLGEMGLPDIEWSLPQSGNYQYNERYLNPDKIKRYIPREFELFVDQVCEKLAPIYEEEVSEIIFSWTI